MFARSTCCFGFALLLFLSAIAASSSASAQAIDQQQTEISSSIASMTLGPLYQSFIPDASEIIGAGVYRVGTTSGDLTLGIYDDLPNLGGSLLISGTALNTSGEGYVDVFWDSTALTPGTTYYLGMMGANYVGSTGEFILSGSGPTNPYADGQAWFLDGANTLPEYDYAFRTYSAVPEPSTAFLLALGLVALSSLRRDEVSR